MSYWMDEKMDEKTSHLYLTETQKQVVGHTTTGSYKNLQPFMLKVKKYGSCERRCRTKYYMINEGKFTDPTPIKQPSNAV